MEKCKHTVKTALLVLALTISSTLLSACKLSNNSLQGELDDSGDETPSPESPTAVLAIDSGPTSYDFGTLLNGRTTDHTFTLTNSGDGDASSVSATSLSSPFSFKGGTYPGTGGTCGTTLLAGSSCTIVVEYSPALDITSNDTLEISYNDNISTQSVSRQVTGLGKALFDKTASFDLNGDAVGNGHTCAITSDKQVACWGWNDDGQLGLNDKTNRTKPELVLAGEQGGTLLGNIAKVAVGRDNSCAVTTTGDVYCWGLGTYNGTGAVTTDAVTPARVVTGDQGDISGYLTGVSTISMGFNFTCVSTLTGEVYCWGIGTNGRTGYGGTSTFNLPKRVVSGEQGGPYLSDIKSVNIGRATACAVTNSGDLYCWGDRRGVGINTTGNQLTPARTLSGAQGGGTYLSNVSVVHVGWNVTCALISTGNVFCWDAGSLTPAQILGGEQGGTYLENITELSYGFTHACAISNTKELFCWGSNHTALPGKILDGSSTPVTDAVKVTAGPLHSCYTKQNGESYCWGSNYTGQLGNNGSLTYFSTLEKVLTDLIE